MISDLKPYPEYKESGLTWLVKVPGHWETWPAFGAFTRVQLRHEVKDRVLSQLWPVHY